MPNRIIKETICTSEEIDSLTPEQEVFFYRLMVNCDDYGLFDGRAKIVSSKCYPLKSLDIECVQSMLNALARVQLISMYEVDGKPYIAISKWSEHQQIRAKRAKFPMPDDGNLIVLDISCNQLPANAPVIQSNPIQSESESESKKPLVVSKLTPCPHQEILFLFSEELPELPQPRIWEGKRQSNLQARWKWVMSQAEKDGKEATKEYGLDFFRRMFGYIAKSDFLMGRSSDWSCDLGWIVNANNFAKIIDGVYENKEAA